MKKIFAVAGITIGAAVIVAGIMTLIRDDRQAPAVADDDGLSDRFVQDGENVVYLNKRLAM